ncbi:MAG: LPS export ABC transporter periplasmic protein LptC [Gammaproteobacteria bacterium]|nr:LPS export ABC transporter periplasmic protein LptC [Gammaproteobacteria bacterium]
MRTTTSLIIILILALASWWLKDFWQETPIVKTIKNEHFPDYFMENFTITNMNRQGEPDYILSASRLDHFADDDSTEIIKPHIIFKEEDGDWSISAQRARILKKTNIIHLYDEVQIIRVASVAQQPLTIKTDYLKVQPDHKIAETDRLAYIKTQQLELKTTGMIFDNNKGILKLLSNVKGSYDTGQ